jgi:release factor glutamine methyltransferase
VTAAQANAERNSVRVDVRLSDLFEAVDGRFDLIVFDPPFRWFAPRDLLESAITDENYRTLTAFFGAARGYLAEGGRLLVFFGTSGDLGYLHRLIDRAGLERETVAYDAVERDGVRVEYFTYRLTACT